MKTNSELQAELDSALRAVTSLAAQRNDLATLVKRLVREIRLVNRTDALAYVAMDYLVRNHLDGDPMRSTKNTIDDAKHEEWEALSSPNIQDEPR